MNDIEKAQNQIEGLKNQIEMAEVCDRLMQNPDFKKLILRYFCVEECARYVQVSGDGNQNDRVRADAMAIAQAAGHLKRFLDVTVKLGEMAKESIKDTEEYITELRQQAESERRGES